jgi:hypothetical protein
LPTQQIRLPPRPLRRGQPNHARRNSTKHKLTLTTFSMLFLSPRMSSSKYDRKFDASLVLRSRGGPGRVRLVVRPIRGSRLRAINAARGALHPVLFARFPGLLRPVTTHARREMWRDARVIVPRARKLGIDEGKPTFAGERNFSMNSKAKLRTFASFIDVAPALLSGLNWGLALKKGPDDEAQEAFRRADH